MSFQESIKKQLLAVSLFAASACGTIALFSCVPVIAKMLNNTSTPPQFQAFPQGDTPPSSQTLRALNHRS